MLMHRLQIDDVRKRLLDTANKLTLGSGDVRFPIIQRLITPVWIPKRQPKAPADNRVVPIVPTLIKSSIVPWPGFRRRAVIYGEHLLVQRSFGDIAR